MVIDARERFAERVAKWMQSSNLSSYEMTLRLNMWPNDFIALVIKAHRRLLQGGPPTSGPSS